MNTYEKYISEASAKYEITLRKGFKGLKLKDMDNEDEATEFAKKYIPKLKYLQAIVVEKVHKGVRSEVFSHQKED